MTQFNFTATLTQINKLQAELMETDKVVKETLQDYIPKNMEVLLNTLIGSSIPNLLLEIGQIIKIIDFQKIFEGGARFHNTNEIPVDIKDEIIIEEEDNNDEDYITGGYQAPLEASILERADQQNQNGKKTIREDNKQKKENKAATSTIQSLSKNSFGQYDLSGSWEEKVKKLNLFVSLCIRSPEACQKLVAHKRLDGSFSCPHCPLMGMWGASNFMVHLVRSHQDSGLIPLPFVRPVYKAKVINTVAKGIKEKEKSKEEVADPLATITTEQRASGPTAETPFVINNEKTLNQFVGACLNFPGVRDHFHMIVYKEADDGKKGFYCPHCESGDRYMIQSIRDVMRHIVRNHPDSEHIPLPFVRQLKLKTSDKKRKREERVEPTNEEMSEEDEDANP